MLPRTFVVANPRAGAGQVEEEWKLIERLLRVKLPEFDFAFTEGPNHATLLTREALREGWEMIVTIGGDGTFNEAANGFFEKVPDSVFERDEDGFITATGELLTPINDQAVFGMIPIGTGGDFRKSLGLSDDIKANLDLLDQDRTSLCDVGVVTFIDHGGNLTSRAFLNIGSAGFSGEVDKVVNGMWKGLGGPASFRIGSTLAWVKWRNRPISLRLDGGERIDGDYFMAVVANGQYFGGGMWVAPQAEIDDGAFEVVLLGDLPKLRSATLLKKIYEGTHLQFAEASRVAARSVSMITTGDQPVLLDVDGEQPGRLPALFSIVPSALKLRV